MTFLDVGHTCGWLPFGERQPKSNLMCHDAFCRLGAVRCCGSMLLLVASGQDSPVTDGMTWEDYPSGTGSGRRSKAVRSSSVASTQSADLGKITPPERCR